jgi:hypothetical protein
MADRLNMALHSREGVTSYVCKYSEGLTQYISHYRDPNQITLQRSENTT